MCNKYKAVLNACMVTARSIHSSDLRSFSVLSIGMLLMCLCTISNFIFFICKLLFQLFVMY